MPHRFYIAPYPFQIRISHNLFVYSGHKFYSLWKFVGHSRSKVDEKCPVVLSGRWSVFTISLLHVRLWPPASFPFLFFVDYHLDPTDVTSNMRYFLRTSQNSLKILQQYPNSKFYLGQPIYQNEIIYFSF